MAGGSSLSHESASPYSFLTPLLDMDMITSTSQHIPYELGTCWFFLCISKSKKRGRAWVPHCEIRGGTVVSHGFWIRWWRGNGHSQTQGIQHVATQHLRDHIEVPRGFSMLLSCKASSIVSRMYLLERLLMT